jgi:MFS family permease
VAGKLGDRVGRRPLVPGGLVWLPPHRRPPSWPSLEVLIAFRVQQALAGALIVPNGVALLREAVPSGRLAARLGLVGSALPLGATLGPPLGGLVLALDGWQGVFLVNLPLLVVTLVVSWRWIPARRRASGSAGFDLSGAALLCASLVALAWLLNGRGLSPPTSAGPVAVVAASAAAFTWRELRHPDPVLDLRLFRRGP